MVWIDCPCGFHIGNLAKGGEVVRCCKCLTEIPIQKKREEKKEDKK